MFMVSKDHPKIICLLQREKEQTQVGEDGGLLYPHPQWGILISAS